MAHYAFLDETNVVVEVITGVDETELIDGLTPEQWYENFRGLKCVRTSYWTAKGKHFGSDGIEDDGVPFRKNYAVIGWIYDPIRDAFYEPQFFASWILNEDTCQWEPPVPYPDEINNKNYIWNEETISWIEITIEG
jgi:hypothetical protein